MDSVCLNGWAAQQKLSGGSLKYQFVCSKICIFGSSYYSCSFLNQFFSLCGCCNECSKPAAIPDCTTAGVWSRVKNCLLHSFYDVFSNLQLQSRLPSLMLCSRANAFRHSPHRRVRPNRPALAVCAARFFQYCSSSHSLHILSTSSSKSSSCHDPGHCLPTAFPDALNPRKRRPYFGPRSHFTLIHRGWCPRVFSPVNSRVSELLHFPPT